MTENELQEQTLAEQVADDAAPEADKVAKAEDAKVEDDAAVTAAEDGEQAGVDGQEEAPELAEWEDDDGTKYTIPPALVPKLLKNKDYTVKTQNLAEQRKAFAAQQEEWEAQKKRDEAELKLDTEIYRLEETAKQYGAVDWDKLANEDFERAQRAHFDYQRTREQLSTLKEQKSARQQERSQHLQQATAKRIEEAEEYAAGNIPGWGAERSRELWDYALKELGYDEQSLRASLDGRLMKLIHKSWVGDKAMAKAKTPASKQTTGTVEPLKTVQAKSSPTTRRNLVSADLDTYREMIKAGADPTLASL